MAPIVAQQQGRRLLCAELTAHWRAIGKNCKRRRRCAALALVRLATRKRGDWACSLPKAYAGMLSRYSLNA